MNVHHYRSTIKSNCMHDVTRKLLMWCPPSSSLPYRLYSGTLVHRLVRKLMGGVAAEHMLEGALPNQLYSSLFCAIQGAMGPACSAPASASSKKRRRRRGGRRPDAGGRRPDAGGIANRFSLLQLDDG